MRALTLLLLLAACASPSPQMAGATRDDVQLNSIDFVVFHGDDRAEVLRMTFLARPSRHDVPRLMA